MTSMLSYDVHGFSLVASMLFASKPKAARAMMSCVKRARLGVRQVRAQKGDGAEAGTTKVAVRGCVQQ